MVAAVTDALTVVLGWIRVLVSHLTLENGNLRGLLPLFAIGIAISAIMLGIKIVRSIVWGA